MHTRRQRIVLCSPPWSYRALGARPPRPGGRDLTGQGHLPELGMHMLATTMDARGHRAWVEEGYGRDPADLLARVRAWAPTVVGVSVQTPLWHAARGLLAALRSGLPAGTRLVVGGPHATLRGGALLEEAPGLDAVFTGPAEGSLLAWLNEGMPGGETRHASEDPPHDAAWATALARRVDWRRYTPNLVFQGSLPFATSVSSVGCARACASCAMGGSGGGRLRSQEELVVEQRVLGRALGIRSLHYMDDMPAFARPGDDADALLAALADDGPCLGWSMYLDRFDLDAARFAALRRAGCQRVLLLVESGDDSVRAYAKGRVVPTVRIQRTAERAHAAGIEVGARFQIGYPGETPDQGRASITLALDLPLTLASFVRAMAYPGSAMARDYRALGRASDDERSWSYYGRPVTPDAMSTQEQQALLDEGVRRFYTRPAAARRLLGPGGPTQRARRGLALARRFFLDGVS
jgi:radical SAM superfamily enzyme YgiQ (UPF0313 family)